MISCSDEEYYYKLDTMVLASSQHVRKVFAKRWGLEIGDEWIDDKEHIQRFLNEPVGRKVLKRAQTFQKKTLKNHCVEEWDIQLLFLILHSLGDKDKYKKENDAVYALKNLRNELAHHKSKKVTKEDYDDKVGVFKRSMESLEMRDEDVEKLVEETGVTSALRAAEAVKKLYEKAESCLKEGKYEEALIFFSEAVEMPSLLPVDRGTAFEKRSEYWFQRIKDIVIDEDKCDHALLDAKRAIELNDGSWKAHHLAAKCYQWKNNLSQAPCHYERALSISPIQTQVRSDYDSCKVLVGGQNRHEHLDPRYMPTNLQERLASLEEKNDVKICGKEFILLNQLKEAIWKGNQHVFRGHQHFAGWGVPQNYTEAVKCYEQAAAEKNAEGMLNLAQCLQDGMGVEQNIPEALRIYREVAEMNPMSAGPETPLKCNVGVAAAEHALGLLYEQGIGVEQDFKEAAKWYQRAMEHGAGESANNLGIMYLDGRGMPKDDKMAEYCLKEAVNLEDPNAATALVWLYLEQWEPDKAEHMIRIAREMDNGLVHRMSENEQFRKWISSVRSEREKREVEIVEFEGAQDLITKGLTFKERLNRRLRFFCPQLAEIRDIFEKGMTNYKGEHKSWPGKAQGFSLQLAQVIETRANQGSLTAIQVMATYTNCLKMNAMLRTPQELTSDQEKKVIDLLYICDTLNHHLLFVWDRTKLKSIVSKWFHEKCASPGEDDMKGRFCFVTFNLRGSLSSDDMYAVELLKEGIRRYPDNEHYYSYLSSIFGCKRMSQKGRSVAEQGLEKFPNQVDLLYDRAVHLKQGPLFSNKWEECIAAYEKFLEVAPVEHRKYPEACYSIANFFVTGKEFYSKVHDMALEDLQKYWFSGESPISDKSPERKVEMEKAEFYYKRGQESEGQQLPCHLPCGKSYERFMVGCALEMAMSTPASCQEGVLERKRYLQSPTRKALTIGHRKKLEHDNKLISLSGGRPLVNETVTPKLRQPAPTKISMVKPITLAEMNPTEDRIYEGMSLDLTILDDPNPHYASIHLIAEDDNGDVLRLYIYNVDKTPENLNNFRAGCRIGIVNPYMRKGDDFSHGIRNDEQRCIVYLEKVENMCRFCGEGNASQKCSKCKRPYCSRECQTLDWKMFNHKLICKLKY